MITWSFPRSISPSYHSPEDGAIMITFAEEAKGKISKFHSYFCPVVPILYKSPLYLDNHNGISAPLVSVPIQTLCPEFPEMSPWLFFFPNAQLP